jgi:DNA polymerase V
MDQSDQKIYLCIDLKSFFASVESVARGLDPFTTDLVVADPTRGNGAICLAVTPSLKSKGVRNRCRLFEIPENIEYIVARPRMKKYMEVSTQIYSLYLHYVCPEDIHVYSIDECFIDATQYLKMYRKTPKDFAKMLMDAVMRETGIRSTAGIGTNLFLAKVALDVTAKHADDFIGELDEESFKATMWKHRPITDIWNVGKGIAARLEKMAIYDLYGVAHADEDYLYEVFGVNAEFLIDHAWGREPCTIADIHAYKSKSASISNGQVLFEDYNFDDALIILQEMVDMLVLELVEKRLVCDSVSLYIGYSDDAIKPTGGTRKIGCYTSSRAKIMKMFVDYYNATTSKTLPIRRINIGLNGLEKETYETVDLLTDKAKKNKEKNLQSAILKIKGKYGKNAIMPAISYEDKATGRQRNRLIGGHASGEED